MSIESHVIERRAQLLKALNRKYVVEKGTIWHNYGGVIVPCAPACQGQSLGWKSCLRLFREFRSPLIMMTDGFSQDTGDKWFTLVCNHFLPVDELKSAKDRSYIRRALKRSEVRMISPGQLADEGYETFVSASTKYTGRAYSIPTQQEFHDRVARNDPFQDIVHCWGVYAEGKMVGFAENLTFGKVEVNFSGVKLHPDYQHLGIGSSLIYRMNEYYLTNGYGYISGGSRCISHETNMQDFLTKNFGFVRTYTNLTLIHLPILGLGIRLAYPFRRLLGRLYGKLYSLFQLEEAGRAKRNYLR